jgi:hypothetical protein
LSRGSRWSSAGSGGRVMVGVGAVMMRSSRRVVVAEQTREGQAEYQPDNI